MRILLAEDNEPLRNALARLLERRGHEVHRAENGRVAVDRAIELMPDVILMDLSMPVMSGLDAAIALRARSDTRAIRIIAMTAHTTEKTKNDYLAAGCDSYIAKPFGIDELISVLDAPTLPEDPFR